MSEADRHHESAVAEEAPLSLEDLEASPEDVVTDHEYDGIREFDNPLPKWWLATFYGAIVFSVVYWFGHHSIQALPSAAETYEEEWLETQRTIAANAIDPAELVAMSSDPGVLERGAEHYRKQCASCHADKGQGNIGPNLTDDYWLYGGSAQDLYTTVALGRTNKGMPAWLPSLGATKVNEVTAYILSIKGTNVAGKAPQGTPES